MNDSEAQVRQILAARPDEAVLLIAGADLREVLRLLDEEAEKAEADLARVTAERDALAARLRRCEALLREAHDAIYNFPERGAA